MTTAKRFYMTKNGDLYDNDNLLMLDFGYSYDGVNCKRIIDLLNELNDENEQLKEAIYSWSKSYNRVYEEKESLKEEKKFLQNKIKTYKSGNALLKKTLDKEWK